MAVKVNGGFSGKIKAFDKMIAYNWKGLQVLRSESPNITQTKSPFRLSNNNAVSFLAQRFLRDLTDVQRSLWDTFAASLNTQAVEISNRIGAGASNIIRPRQKLMSGFNAYISSNIIAFVRGFSGFPRDQAPLSANLFPAPQVTIVGQTATGVDVRVQTTVGLTALGAAEGKVAVFVSIQKVKRLHTQIAAVINLPADPLDTTITITTVRGKKQAVVVPLPITSFKNGLFRVQADLAVARTATEGPIVSAPSNLDEAKLVFA